MDLRIVADPFQELEGNSGSAPGALGQLQSSPLGNGQIKLHRGFLSNFRQVFRTIKREPVGDAETVAKRGGD